MFKYSYDSLVYYGEDVEKSIKRVAECGYDGIELVGEPDNYDTDKVNKLINEYGIKVSSICSIYNEKRDLVHPDKGMRKKAVDYVKSVAEMAAKVNCPVIIVAPSACMKTESLGASFSQEEEWAVEGIREGGEYAKKLGVSLCIEAWNRYETYWVNRLDQCLDLMKKVNLDNVGVMGDTFHMNIEEESIADAMRNCKDSLIHVHLADSNRAAPGRGHIDFKPILEALKEIDYKGYLTFEILPAAADPFGVMERGGGQEFFDKYTKESIDYIKKIEKQIG